MTLQVQEMTWIFKRISSNQINEFLELIPERFPLELCNAWLKDDERCKFPIKTSRAFLLLFKAIMSHPEVKHFLFKEYDDTNRQAALTAFKHISYYFSFSLWRKEDKFDDIDLSCAWFFAKKGLLYGSNLTKLLERECRITNYFQTGFDIIKHKELVNASMLA